MGEEWPCAQTESSMERRPGWILTLPPGAIVSRGGLRESETPQVGVGGHAELVSKLALHAGGLRRELSIARVPGGQEG